MRENQIFAMELGKSTQAKMKYGMRSHQNQKQTDH